MAELDEVLITKQDAIDLLNAVTDIRGHSYKELHDFIIAAPPRALIRFQGGMIGITFYTHKEDK